MLEVCTTNKNKIIAKNVILTFYVTLTFIFEIGYQKVLISKVNGEGQLHAKDQNKIFGHIFVLFVAQTSNMSHIVAYGKAKLA